jgi:hypothetical protein
MSRVVKRNGNYISNAAATTKEEVVRWGKKSILFRSNSTARTVVLQVGGHTKWCVNVELIRSEPHSPTMKEIGYLVKIRYDELCSLDHTMSRGGDTKQLMMLVLQYIHDHYPAVKKLSYNDLSMRRCDNGAQVNLAVMTTLYTGKTWYEKSFGATVAEQSIAEHKKYMDTYEEKKRSTTWDDMHETIHNHKNHLEGVTEEELGNRYRSATSWQAFFQPLCEAHGIGAFSSFVSEWQDRFIAKYINNLQGLTYWMPIQQPQQQQQQQQQPPITYTVEAYQKGGKHRRRLTYKKSGSEEHEN